MRKTKTLDDIGGKPVTVYEIRPRDVMALFADGAQIVDEAKALLPRCCSLTMDEILDLYPSESAMVWAAFEEVNKAFFDVLRAAGVFDQAREVIQILLTDVRAQFVARYKLAMQAQQIMDGSSS